MSHHHLIEIDLNPISTKRELHAALARALDFPGWYGHNWDAFWDAITGLVEMPENLRFVGWDEFAARLPVDAQHVQDLLAEMAKQYPDDAADVTYA